MRVFVVVALTLGVPSLCLPQVTPDLATGVTPYAEYIPSDIDNVNPVNGNLFLKIPLLSYPQRGDKLRLAYYIFYNDKQWQAGLHPYCNPNCVISGQWTPAGISQSSGVTTSSLGVYVARDQFVSYQMNYGQTVSQTFGIGSDSYTENAEYLTETASTPDGAVHYIADGIQESCSAQPLATCPAVPSKSGLLEAYPATDASGFDQYGHGPDGIIYGYNNGLQVLNYSSLAVSDPNGNSITASSQSGWTDTYNRVIPGTNSGPGVTAFPSPTSSYIGIPMADLVPGTPTSPVPQECAGSSAARTWTVPASESYGSGSATYYFCYTYENYQTAFDLSSVMPTQADTYSVSEGSPSVGFGQALLLTAIVLPDGRSYTFAYDQYLSLITLGLPSGATISYTWQNVLFYPYPTISSAGPGAWGGMVTPMSRALSTRTVNPGNGQPEITTSYHWYLTASQSPTGGGTANGVQFPAYGVVTDSNGNDTEYTLGGTDDAGYYWPGYVLTAAASYSGCSPHHTGCSGGTGTKLQSESYALTATISGGGQYNSPAYIPQAFTIPPTKETQITTHTASSAGDMLSRVTKSLTPHYGLPTIGSSCTVYTYPEWGSTTLQSQQSQNCYSVSEVASSASYDFGSPGSGSVGSLLRTQTTSYQWQSSQSYLDANLLDLVNEQLTTDSQGNWAAETDFRFDQSPSPSGARGNQTSESRHISSSSSVVSQTQYNSNGTVSLLIDPDGNETSYVYSGSLCNDALPQSVTKAYGSTSTTPETTIYSYDCHTTKVTSLKDPNSKTTTFTYDDPLSRVTAASFPDGGAVSVDYNDSLPLTMTVTTQTGEATGPRVATTTYDGLARKIHSQIQPQSNLTISVDTNYDNMGRVYTVSNPYYSTGEYTYGQTTTLYDALGRPVKVTNPDSTSRQMCYAGIATSGQSNCNGSLGTPFAGSWTDSTDEKGNDTQRSTDGLGRLTRVMEPNGSAESPSMQTDYVYNALDDLTSATQWGGAHGSSGSRTRSLAYDGLSRLIQSLNPESGWVCYSNTGGSAPNGSNCTVSGYDNNGNLKYKTDARGITTSISYDALNRVLSKTYSNDPGHSPFACYQYDASSVANGIGRLSNAWTQSYSANNGTCASAAPTGGFLTKRAILSYDAMGRVLNEQQVAPSNTTNGTITPPCRGGSETGISYCYDLAGSLTFSTNGMNSSAYLGGASPITFANTADSAGRLLTITSNWTNNNLYPAQIFGPSSAQSLSCSNSLSTQYTASGALANANLGIGLSLNRAYDKRWRTTCEIDSGYVQA